MNGCATCYRIILDLGCLIRDDNGRDYEETDCPLWLSAEKWKEINSEGRDKK